MTRLRSVPVDTACNVQFSVKMQSRIESITPEKATEYLKHNKNNRPVTKSLVNFLARQMPTSWRVTHQGIAFDKAGNLIDGQHRLMAVVESQATIRLMVTRGADPETMIVVDTHRARTDADALTIAGFEDVTRRKLATLKFLLRGTRGAMRRMTRDEQARELQRHDKALRFVAAHVGYSAVTAIAPVSGAIARAYYHVPRGMLSSFCIAITQNKRVKTESSAALLLYKFIQEGALDYSGQSRHSRDAYLRTEAAIHAFVNEQKLKSLKAAEEELYPLKSDDDTLAEVA